MTMLEMANATVCYGRTPAVHHVTASCSAGDLVAVIGPNGAGKSTLLRGILGWQPLATGRITIDGKSAESARNRISYLPQRSQIDWDFPVHVDDVVAMGRYHQLGFARGFGESDRAVVDSAVAEMGLNELRKRQIGTLSGGQQQRTLLARALASGANIFLLDEPFAGLDPQACMDLVRRLLTWTRQGRLVLVAMHEVDLVRNFFTHVMLLRKHLIAYGTVVDTLTQENIQAAFGRAVP
jgi:ABC-type Mn2+/Zn2+ transport system ATPase subunit